MKENYASIPSRIRGGTYGNLGEILSDAVYKTISPGTTFVTPPDLGTLVIPTGSTNINSVYINQDHSEACR